ncbi:MAG: SGNH/GDSL hydrolase family protein [Paracoccaceae bacterium]
MAQVVGRDRVTVVAFGTSLTNRPGWVDALSENLSGCSHPTIDLRRLSQPGANSRWALTQIETLAAMRPDIVLMEFAINDADLYDGVGLAQTRELTTRVLSALHTDIPEARIVLMTMNPVRGLINQARRPRLADYYQSYRDIAAGHHTGLIDFAARWNAAAVSAAEIPDGLHPTAAASTKLMTGILTNYLARATGSAGCSQ